MRPTFRKLEIKDVRDIEKLVTENAENIEPGLKIIDSCLQLGHARVDLVGVDAKEQLVLTALGFTANEDMLLRALEAYSWCLEFPETVRRLYPRTRFHPGRLPRVLFIAERMPDSFVRKVKQLNVPELDCLTFLHLDVNGTPAVYFDVIERIRRGGDQRLVDGTPIISDLPMEQHPFIEGTPPETPWDDPNGNAAWQRRLADTSRAEQAAEGGEQFGGQWQQMAGKLAAEAQASGSASPLEASLLTPAPDAAALDEGMPADAGTAVRGDNIDQYKGEWREFLDRLGSAQLPQNGKLSRGAQGFGSQFETTE